jgi:cation transport ATPase
MTHTYQISGMTCEACAWKVKHVLEQIPGVTASVNWQTGEAIVTMEKHVPLADLQNAFKPHPKYQLTENSLPVLPAQTREETRTWLETYKPILLIFAFITAVGFLAQFPFADFSWMLWMNHFMAGFFLVFSFFKMLNLRGFAESYAMYDIIARRWQGYGIVYAFIELTLGLFYLVGVFPLVINLVTFVVMTISLAGVLQSVLSKKKIRCACLGAVFNLPMSTVTIIEDALMIAMSGFMAGHLLLAL